jgi:hypothetical protein
MRAFEILHELRKKKSTEPKAGDTTPHDYDPGWEQLNRIKQAAKQYGEEMTERYQLFVPRGNGAAQSARDRRLKNLASPYAYDDEGNLQPSYDDWEKPRKELSPTGQDDVKEAAPFLAPGKSNSPPGGNKPEAAFWTSTARKTNNGWTSDWAKWISENHPSWFSPVGYLYKVTPGALITQINSDRDAERIYYAFQNLGRAEMDHNDSYGRLTKGFPWDQLVKHVDAVNHSGFRFQDSRFVYGWDVESTAWFDTSHLQLVGEVPVAPPRGNDDDVFS